MFFGGGWEKALEAEADAKALEELPLGQGPQGDRPAEAGGAGERAEVDVRGEVGLAGGRERVDRGVVARGLERVGERGMALAVVDDESQATLVGEAAAELLGQRLAGGRDLEHGPLGRLRY